MSKENYKCIFCESSNQGYVCGKCSTSGVEYKITCPACFTKIYYEFNHPKKEREFVIDNLNGVCEECKKSIKIESSPLLPPINK